MIELILIRVLSSRRYCYPHPVARGGGTEETASLPPTRSWLLTKSSGLLRSALVGGVSSGPWLVLWSGSPRVQPWTITDPRKGASSLPHPHPSVAMAEMCDRREVFLPPHSDPHLHSRQIGGRGHLFFCGSFHTLLRTSRDSDLGYKQRPTGRRGLGGPHFISGQNSLW